MSVDNPYAAPRTPASARTGPRAGMLFASIGAVFASSAIGGVMGLAVGAALGAFVPDYYRSVIAGGSQPGFNPLAVGVGLGLTQGMLVGGTVGVALVGLFYWYRLRLTRRTE